MNRTIAFFAAGLNLAVAGVCVGNEPGRESLPLPPFLEVLQSVHQVTVTTKQVHWPSAIGKRQGLLAQPDDNEKLPALVVFAGDSDSEFYKRAAREFAEIGYVVLVVDLPPIDETDREVPADAIIHEQTLSSLTAAVRWLRGRDDVSADRIGAVAWSAAATWALELTADQHLQACVLCDAQLPRRMPPALASQLRGTGILLVNGTAGQVLLDAEIVAPFKQSLAAAGIDHQQLAFDKTLPGFMDSARKTAFDLHTADRAWFEIYEFLGKHVEDADIKQLLAERGQTASRPLKQFASIADLMRVLNAPTGVRGQLSKALGDGPADEMEWKQVASQAALLAESAELLSVRQPPKGKTATWLRHTATYRNAATSLSTAATARDLSAARAALLRLNNTCGQCHLDHR